ncbi:lipase [Halenospora varia]|nr:lipase [Halenospora varia]
MKTSSTLVLAFSFLSDCIVASPIVGSQNASVALELRATPTTVTAAILANMKLFAQYAAAAYCNSDASKVGTKVSCSSSACPSLTAVTNYAFLGYDQSEASGFVGVDTTNKLIVASFAGSDNIDNYIADLLVPMDTCSGNLVSGCKLHTGFQYAYQDIEDTLLPAVASARSTYPSYTVITTGHSLGGAVATIAGAYLRASGIPVDIYSYGSPRVGNTAFVNSVTHTDDFVPRYPGKLLGYRHTSPEFWLSTGDDTTTNYAISDIKVCQGISNTDCNDGTSSLSTTPHSYYFQDISACK